jgi:hypothetical protein
LSWPLQSPQLLVLLLLLLGAANAVAPVDTMPASSAAVTAAMRNLNVTCLPASLTYICLRVLANTRAHPSENAMHDHNDSEVRAPVGAQSPGVVARINDT